MGAMKGIENGLKANVNDMFSHAKAIVHENLYALNHKHYSGYMWVACLDWKTCQVCGSLDGKIFPALPGEDGGPPDIPRHFNCRCVIVPVLKGMEDDYTGSPNYRTWFERQTEKTQIDILGPSRFALFKNGLPVERFVKDGRVLTLKELGALRTTRKELFNLSRSSGIRLEFKEVPNNDEAIREALKKAMAERGIAVDFDESAKETIDYIIKLHDRVISDFPAIQDVLKEISYTANKKILSNGQAAGYDNILNILKYNRSIFNSKENLLAYINQKKGWFASNQLSGQIAHEYGHVIENLLIKLNNNNENVVSDIVRRTLIDNGIKSWSNVRDQISLYAGKEMSYGELVAEVVSDFLTQARPRRISELVYNELIKLYRRI